MGLELQVNFLVPAFSIFVGNYVFNDGALLMRAIHRRSLLLFVQISSMALCVFHVPLLNKSLISRVGSASQGMTRGYGAC